MNTAALRAFRMLGPSDLRLVWRDGFVLSFLVVVLPLVGLLLKWVVPVAADLVAEWVVLEPYYGLIVANAIVAGEPVLIGFVVGVLFVEERDSGTLLAIQASPLSLRGFLAYRLGATMMLNVPLTIIGVLFADLVSLSWFALVASAVLASMIVPVVALVYAVFIRNKVQALMLLKPLQIWGGVPTLLFFVPTPWEWIGSIPGPLYYPMRLFVGAAQGQPEWWLIGPGLIIPGAMILWLFRRFERVVYA